MVNAVDLTNWTHNSTESGQNIKTTPPDTRRIKFDICPLCDRKGYYKIHQRYEHCRLCGMYRILVPGQDF